MNEATSTHSWRQALPYAGAIATIILALFYHWFARANRYVIFLYGHLGAAPFDSMTNGRYAMAGLVATGSVLVGWLLWHWFAGRLAALRYRRYVSPAWLQIWLLCLPLLAVGIPLITMTSNQPTLPFSLAALCTGVTLAGLAFALWPGAQIAHHPAACGWLGLYGLGLTPLLLLLRAVELPSRGLATTAHAWSAAGGSLVTSWLWLALVTRIHTRRAQQAITAPQLFAAGVCVSYLLLPLLHHLFFVPPDYRYITTSGNFFAFNPWMQIATFALAGVTTAWIARGQRQQKRSPHE